MLTRAAFTVLLASLAIAAVLAARQRRRKTPNVTVVAADWRFALQHATEIVALVASCFPDDGLDTANVADTLDVLSGFHDPQDCQWLFAFGAEPTASGRQPIVGLAMMVPYHDSLYVCSLCVHHSLRRRGLGALLMRSASAHAHRTGLPNLSGSVATDSAHLLRFYAALGAQFEPTFAIGSAGATVSQQRLRAPSGPATALDVPAPRWAASGSDSGGTTATILKSIASNND